MSLNDLYIINENFSNGFWDITLNIMSVVSVFSAIMVIISKNPVVSVLYLIGLFVGISSYLIITGISFIGLSYLLVYVGAVSILFLFILMLINIRISELVSETRNSIALVLVVTLSFSLVLGDILPNSFLYIMTDTSNLYSVTSDNWDNTLIESSHITSIGNIMYTNYSIWLIITSIILLLAMVGAIIITIKTKEEKRN